MSRILTQANFAHYHQVVLSQAPPLVPPGLELDSSASSATDWILENHTYKSWRQPGVSILHIYGTSGISAVSRNLCEHINADWKDYVDRTHTFFFEFDRYDVRCNNVQAMLSSFMSQMISRYTSLDRMRDDLNSCLELHCAYQSWSMRNIFATFKRVRRRKGPTKAEIIISRLDQCDDSRFWLLDQLALISWYDEQPWRVIITTQNDEKLNEALSKFPGINMDGCPTQGVHISDVVGLCEKQLAEVIRDRPLLAAHKTKLGELLQECREDVQLAQLLLDCLSHVELGASEVERRELLEALSPVSLASIFQTRLERSNVPTKPWRRDVLRVLKHIVRPVTWNELTFILGLVDGVAQIQPPDIYVDEIAKDVLWAFGMFISVQGHEVRLQRRFLEQATIPEAESAAAHAEMANRCLDYLGIAAVQKQIQSFCDHYDELSESPLFAPRRNLISYAVMYWTTHYRLAGSEKPFKQACKFFRNPEAKNAWAAAYYTLANPFTRTDRGYKSPLPVVCMTGLEDLVIEFISSEKPLKGFREDCGLALSEAARHGHIGTARLLMKASSPTNRDLQDAITAAASFGHGGALEELLEYASTLNDFQWPPDLVGQVAWHGLDKAAKLLINAGIDINVQKTVDGNTPLHHAAREGHVETLRAMLQADPKPDLTVQNKFGSKPLHQAAVHGHPELIRVLLDAGADIDDTSSQGRTPLQLATSWSKPNAVEVLLDRSAKMDVTQDEEPKSIWNAHPIFSASINGSKRCMEHLLRNEADIKIKYKIGSPLYYAVAEKNLEVARMLLEAGADPNEKPENSDLILILAVEGGNIDMVSLLLEYGARVNEENSDSWRNTALSRAAGTGKEELVRFLIEKGKADVNYYGKYSQPPIYVAAFTCHAGIVQILIDHEADVNVALWGRKWCALHASYDAPEVAKLLLENGAEIDRECDDGTVLFLASLYNKPDVVKVLLNHKPNPPNLEIQRPDDVGDEAGMTALSIACKNHHLKIMRLLLEAGANPNHMTKVGSSPLKLCLKRPAGADKAVKILLEYAPDLDRRDEEGNTVLHDCHRWNRSVARHLVNAGADVRALNKAGQSPLYNAVNSGSTDIVRYLLSKHADPNVQSPNGSLLYVALDWGLDMIRALVEGGANVHSADSSPDNKEGLINTILKRYPDPLDIVKYLVETGGIDINKKRGNLAYPLLTACQRGQADIVRYLLSRGAEPNVVDDLSRRALHLAAISQDSLSALLESNVDVQKYEPEAKGDDETTPPQQQQQQRQPIRDNMSRTPLHFAASSDEPPAFWRVKNMYPDRAAAEPDDKGWTPLFWALRRKYPDREVVAELLKHGRGVWSRAKGPSGGDWSPLKLARYVGAPEEITKMLVPESTKKGRRGEMWEPDEHVSRVATRHYAYCDSCFVVSFARFLPLLFFFFFFFFFVSLPFGRSGLHLADHLRHPVELPVVRRLRFLLPVLHVARCYPPGPYVRGHRLRVRGGQLRGFGECDADTSAQGGLDRRRGRRRPAEDG